LVNGVSFGAPQSSDVADAMINATKTCRSSLWPAANWIYLLANVARWS